MRIKELTEDTTSADRLFTTVRVIIWSPKIEAVQAGVHVTHLGFNQMANYNLINTYYDKRFSLYNPLSYSDRNISPDIDPMGISGRHVHYGKVYFKFPRSVTNTGGDGGLNMADKNKLFVTVFNTSKYLQVIVDMTSRITFVDL